jgi:HlyD family secretion protein
MTKKRWMTLGAIGGVVAIVAAIFLTRGRASAQPNGLQTVEAATGDLTATVGATGTVRARQSTVLTFQTSGVVAEVEVEQGQRVSEDQVLATLELTSLSPQVILAQADLVSAQRALDLLLNSDLARAQAQQALAQARDALDEAEYRWRNQQQGYRASGNTIDGARANLVLAEAEVGRAQDAFNQVSGQPADSEVRALYLSVLSAARTRRDSAARTLNWYLGRPNDIDQALLDANVAAAEAHLADAQREWDRLRDGPDPSDVAAAEARVAAAQATADLARIAAPFAGTITSVDVMPGDQVSPGTLAFGLADLSHLLVDVEVTEVDINRVRVGQPVSLAFDAALGVEYQGIIVEIPLVGTPGQGVVNFPVTVEVSDPDQAIRPGMTAAVNIVVEQIENVLLVPNRAVRVRGGERVVYALRSGQPVPIPVVLGVSSDAYSQILEGEVRVGDLIVLNPPIEFDTSGPPSFMMR